MIYFALQDYENAILLLTKVTLLEPNKPNCYYMRGYINNMRVKQFGKTAMADFYQCIQVAEQSDPFVPKGFYYLII